MNDSPTTRSTTLHKALRQRGLGSRKDARQGRILTQDGCDVGRMAAHIGWCLVRLYDGALVDDYARCDVTEARRLLAGVNRPPPKVGS